MISKTNADFWECYNALPVEIQKLAKKNFELWKSNSHHNSFQFKVLGADIWSVRIGNHYRAIGRRKGDFIVWYWIGTHEEYNGFRF